MNRSIINKIALVLKSKKIYILLALLLVILIPDTAFALTSDEIKQQVVTKTNVVISFLNALLWPMLLLIGSLLDNDLIFGAGIEERLLTIWVQFRDFTNIAFVVVLLIAALANIFKFSEGDSNWSLKAVLPKFVLGLLLINFSFVGAKVVLDASNVVTSAVFALPDAVKQEDSQLRYKKNAQEICTEINRTGKTPLYSSQRDQWLARFCNPDTRGQAIMMESMLSNFNTRNAAFALAINMGKMHLTEIKKPTAAFIKDFLLNSLFSLVMFIIYATTFVALAVVLVGRLVILWLAVTLSPLLVAGVILKDLLGGAEGKAGEIKDKVIASIQAPIIIGLFMSIGYIMVDTFYGRDDYYFDLPLGGTGAQVAGMEDLRQMLIAIITIAIVWEGITIATQGALFGETFNSLVRDKLKSAGTWLATAPFKYIPMIPVPTAGGKKNISLSGLLNLPGMVRSKIESGAASRAQDILGFGPVGKFMRELETAQATGDRKQIAQKIKEALTNPSLIKSDQALAAVIRSARNIPAMSRIVPQLEKIRAAQGEAVRRSLATSLMSSQDWKRTVGTLTGGNKVTWGKANEGEASKDYKDLPEEAKRLFNEAQWKGKNVTVRKTIITGSKNWKEVAKKLLKP